jgi:hypothetical protein
MKALAAAQQGEYEIALVEKALGFCQFRAHLQTDGREVTVLVRGKNKGGAACPTRVEPGVYVIVDGDPGKMMEVMGVVNRQAALDKLRGAGRVKKAKEETDDLFEEESGGAVAAGSNLWAKRDEEREEMAQALVRRYQRREAEGGKARLAAAERVTKVAEDAATSSVLGAGAEDVEEEVDIADYLGLADGEGSPKKGITSKRRLAAMAAKAAEADAAAAQQRAEAASAAAAWRAMAAAAGDDDGGVWGGVPSEALKPLEPFSKGKSWEEAADELDIDKI